jgi:hypothetical protein
MNTEKTEKSTKLTLVEIVPRVGRPTKYDPAMCEDVIYYGSQGKSRTAIAALLGCGRNALWVWENQYPEFKDALTRASELSQLWWEEAGQQGMLMPGFGASVWSRSMAARFPAEWREISRQEQTGPDGGAIKTETRVIRQVIVDPKASE